MKSKGLTRGIGDRIFIGLLGLVFAPITGLMTFVFFMKGGPGSHEDWVLRVWFMVLMEGVFAAFCVAVLGVLWAVFLPGWIERLLRNALRHFVTALLLMGIFVAGLLCYVFFFMR